MTAAPIPRLVIRDPPPDRGRLLGEALGGFGPIGNLAAVLNGTGETARETLASLLRALVEEGQRYAETPEGRRWAQLLDDAPAVRHGWMLWNQLNVDHLVRNAAPLADNPATMIEDALRDMAATDLATLAAQLSAIAAEIEAADGRAP